jgi:UDP:flavonoid glycosyltransferase YjiC (YdhE family)
VIFFNSNFCGGGVPENFTKNKNKLLQGKSLLTMTDFIKAFTELMAAYTDHSHDNLFVLTPLKIWNGILPSHS